MSKVNFVPKHKKNLGFEFQGRSLHVTAYMWGHVHKYFCGEFFKELDTLLAFESHLIDLIQRPQT